MECTTEHLSVHKYKLKGTKKAKSFRNCFRATSLHSKKIKIKEALHNFVLDRNKYFFFSQFKCN